MFENLSLGKKIAVGKLVADFMATLSGDQIKGLISTVQKILNIIHKGETK